MINVATRRVGDSASNLVRIRCDDSTYGYGHEWVNLDHVLTIRYSRLLCKYELNLINGGKISVSDEGAVADLNRLLGWTPAPMPEAV
jgi:hypothetical protein